MKKIRTIIDYCLLIIFGFIFIYHIVFTAILDISFFSILTNAGHIFVASVSITLLSLLISVTTSKNIFESKYPLELNKIFRIVILLQFAFYVIILLDFLRIPKSYGDLSKLPLRHYIVGNLPILIWLARVYFKRLVTIENKLIYQ